MKQFHPTRDVWASTYRKLYRAWDEAGAFGVPPPEPLSTSGRDFSDQQDRFDRWQRTVQWATEMGLQHLVPKPPVEDKREQ